MSNFGAVNEVYKKYFTVEPLPARICYAGMYVCSDGDSDGDGDNDFDNDCCYDHWHYYYRYYFYHRH